MRIYDRQAPPPRALPCRCFLMVHPQASWVSAAHRASHWPHVLTHIALQVLAQPGPPLSHSELEEEPQSLTLSLSPLHTHFLWEKVPQALRTWGGIYQADKGKMSFQEEETASTKVSRKKISEGGTVRNLLWPEETGPGTVGRSIGEGREGLALMRILWEIIKTPVGKSVPD